ncbi:hypothetical protein BDZ45DRAFT_743886 [Acephala macrosclerotiorum]|nr:hypothetical protein BDZ45DRAFT_743886 [Acephala macrosclerotiorum]
MSAGDSGAWGKQQKIILPQGKDLREQDSEDIKMRALLRVLFINQRTIKQATNEPSSGFISNQISPSKTQKSLMINIYFIILSASALLAALSPFTCRDKDIISFVNSTEEGLRVDTTRMGNHTFGGYGFMVVDQVYMRDVIGTAEDVMGHMNVGEQRWMEKHGE